MIEPFSAGDRRVVTFVDGSGKSRMLPDKAAPRVIEYKATPGMRTSILWSTQDTPALGGEPNDPAPSLASIHPPVGGSTFLILTLPPGTTYAASDFDPVAAAEEQHRLAPGIVERMETDAPGFHRTDTVDYIVVLDGEIWLAVDAEEMCLTPGDTVVQGGTRHAWFNRSTSPATLAVVLIGAKRP